jgi:hypothetical protein
MFSSTILDVAIGVVFGFLAVSLAAGAVVEAFNSGLKTRSTTLLKAVQDLVNDPDFKHLAFRLYQHALVNPRASGATTDAQAKADPPAPAPAPPPAPVLAVAPADPAAAPAAPPPPRKEEKDWVQKNLPAYIDPAQFAEAFIDVLSGGQNALANAQQLAQGLSASPLIANNPQMKGLIEGIVRRTQGDMNEVKAQLAHWFDSSMDRVSGAFKRRMQLWTFIAALIISALFNVDALRIAQVVWQQPALIDQLKIPGAVQSMTAGEKKDASGGTSDPWAALTLLNDRLPLGWPNGQLFYNAGLPSILGWLITALASLFGAPFWFDLLQKAVRLKGAGPSPDEKKTGKAAAS